MAGPETESAARRGLWFGIVGAPAAWLAQALLGWRVAAQSCAQADRPAVLSLAAARAIELGITALALLVALAALWCGIRAWRHAGNAEFGALRAQDRPAILAAAAIIVSGVFALGIVWAGLAAALLPVCAALQ